MSDMFDQRYYIEQDHEMLQRVKDTFPERQILDSFIADDKDANVNLLKDAEVEVTFISEGAGFKNTFGYFTFDRDSNGEPILESMSDLIPIFNNASQIDSGGSLRPGDTVDLGFHCAGTNIGFYVIADGYNGGKNTYYSISEKANPDGLKHVAAVFDLDAQAALLGTTFFGFEDLYNGGDKDYNDIIFTVKTTPWTAMDRTKFGTTDEIYWPNKIPSRCATCCNTC